MDKTNDTRTIVIDPVTRIEGHAKITIQLDENGNVVDARFHVNEFRGFEKFCEGRLVWEMPGLTSRICGICPASHLIASAKAGDAILAIQIPETAELLRRLLTLGQWIQSHALSFFHLSSPDFLLGFDADPATRNLFGLLANNKEFVRKGIRLRKFGQEIIATLGGRRIHTPWAVAGGVRDPLSDDEHRSIAVWLPEAKATVLEAMSTIKRVHDKFQRDIPNFGNFRSMYVGLVGEEGELEYYGGSIRVKDGMGNTIAHRIDPSDYAKYFEEKAEDWTYLKVPYYKQIGHPEGMYRVGPLARLNICDRIGTPLAEAERRVFRDLAGESDTVNNAFYYHYARTIEMLFAVEEVERLLAHPKIQGTHIRARAMINSLTGVGACEAPRGVLFHHYQVDENGVLQKVNMLIATAQNNMAMNRTVQQLAARYLDGKKVTEGVLNRIEAGIRCYDPCLSCSTHASGHMAMHVQLVASDGSVLDERRR
ncbi:MAG: Ni/Fe hydrogenase subunit alpha [Bacteroidetes bacterium]|jgi:NAD-reducing hydrogenase large subunit|nr:Ni/Fe hydrogenase subunit alpha [Bacteroidota bacterium]